MWRRQGLVFRPVERGDMEVLRAHRNESVGTFRDPMHAWEGDQEDWFRSLNRERQAFMVFEGEVFDGGTTHLPVGLLRFTTFDWMNRSVHFGGCDVFAHARGRRIAVKISAAAAEYAFAEWGMHRIWGVALATNERMVRAMLSAGYVEEGRFRQAYWREGKWVDFVQVSRLSTDGQVVDTSAIPGGA